MNSSESIFEFYKRTVGEEFLPESICDKSIGHINIFSRDNCALLSPYRRRDYFKVSLIIGTGTLHYADRWIYVDRPALLFSNPSVRILGKPSRRSKKAGFVCSPTSFYKAPV